MYILHIINMLLPFITFPHIIQTIGVINFGKISFYSSIIYYFGIIIDYGFNITNVKEISENRNDIKKLRDLFNSTTLAKISIFTFILILYFFFLILIELPSNDVFLLNYTFLSLLSNLFSCNWFLQGLEKFKALIFLNLMSRILYTVFILFFISSSKDFVLIPLITSITSIFPSFFAFIYILNKYSISLNFTLSQLKKTLRDNYQISLSQLSINLYTNSTPILLGLFSTNLHVGYYSSSERLINVVKSFISPFIQTIYPHFNLKNYSEISKAKYKIKLIKISLIFSSIFCFIAFLIYIFKTNIVVFIYGSKNFVVENLLIILSFLPVVISIGSLFVFLGHYRYGNFKKISSIFIYVSFVHILYSSFFILKFNSYGAAFSILITESIILFFSIQTLKTK